MGKTLFAISTAALMVSFIAGWAVTDTQARTPAPTVQIDTFHMMTSAQQLPTEHFADYSFVF
jgi:hypothetical protein